MEGVVSAVNALRGPSKVRLKDGSVSMSQCSQREKGAVSYHSRPQECVIWLERQDVCQPVEDQCKA